MKIIIDNDNDKICFEEFAKKINLKNYEFIKSNESSETNKLILLCLPNSKKHDPINNAIDISKIYINYDSFAAAYKDNKLKLIIDFYDFFDRNISNYKLPRYNMNLNEYINELYDYDINNLNIKIKSGFDQLDNSIKGIQPQLYTICGETNIGKTAFVLQLALQVLLNNQNIKIVYYTMEHTPKIITDRIITLLSKIDNNPIDITQLTNESEKISNLHNKYKKVLERFKIRTQSNIKASDIYVDAQNYADKKQKIVIFIDYLQFLKPENILNSDYQMINEKLESLKNTILSFNYPIFAISSLSRNGCMKVYDKKDKDFDCNEILKALKGSGNIEYSSEVILYLGTKEEKKEKIDLISLKNKNGIDFKLKYEYDSRYLFFKEVTEKETRF